MTASKLALALIAGSLSAAASASTPLSAQQIIQQFDLVSLGNVTSSTEVEGRAYIGGISTGGQYAAKTASMTNSEYAGLTIAGTGTSTSVTTLNNGAVIFGSLTGGTMNNNNGSYVGATAAVLGTATNVSYGNGVAAYVGTNGGGNSYSGAGTTSTLPATYDVAKSTNFTSVLTGLSTSLRQLESTGSYTTSSGGSWWPTTTFNAVANEEKVAVFNLTSADLAANAFHFNYGSAQTVIINVDASGTGKDVKIGANFEGATEKYVGTNTIWNFYNVDSIEISAQFGGTILAPTASLTNKGQWDPAAANIEGSVLVGSLTQYSEIHHANFTGTVPSVPEPETYAMMLGGLALMAGIARRRRAA